MSVAPDEAAALEGVVKNYGRVRAVDGLDLSLRGGELLAMLGPNGAGKSSCIGMLLGLTRPDRGRATLFGRDPQRVAARRLVGVMLQSAELPGTLRVAELLRLTASYYPQPRGVAEAAERAGIGALLRRPYAKLSGGQKRSVQFALALIGRPRLLFLDEPTVGMDIAARERLWTSMRDLVGEGCAVVLTTHYLEEAEALADRVLVMQRGRVLTEGSVDQLRAGITGASVRCRTRLGKDTLAGWAGVDDVEVVEGQARIRTGQAEALLRRLLEADPGLSELEVRRAGLADAFQALTRDAEAGEEVM